jgi:hypothetical protein
MARLRPDPSFYVSSKLATEAPPACVWSGR